MLFLIHLRRIVILKYRCPCLVLAHLASLPTGRSNFWLLEPIVNEHVTTLPKSAHVGGTFVRVLGWMILTYLTDALVVGVVLLQR